MLKLKLSPYSNTIISSRKEMLWIPSCWEKMLVIRLYWKIWYEGIQLQNRLKGFHKLLSLGKIFCFFPWASIFIPYFIKVTTSVSCLSLSMLSHLFLARAFSVVLTPLHTRLSSPLGFLPVEHHALFTPAITLSSNTTLQILSGTTP